MRYLALPLVLVATAAHAAPVDDLETTGQALARDGKYAEAIATFHAAEAAEPRAIHDCLIGLAYLRMGALTDADIAFGDCNRRAGSPDALPAWVAKEQATAAAQLAASSLGTVEIVAPADVATLAVDGVLEGKPFAARRQLRLTPGGHQITGYATDGRSVTRTLTVPARGSVKLELSFAGDGASDAATPAPSDEAPRSSHTGPLALTVAGGAFILAGAASHLLWARPARAAADDATDLTVYNRELDRFQTARAVTIASYAVGGVALIAGLVWWKQSSKGPQVSGYVTGNSGALVLQWQH